MSLRAVSARAFAGAHSEIDLSPLALSEAVCFACAEGLREGDLIISINKKPIYSLNDVERAVDEDDVMLLLNVVRGNSGLFIVIR